MQGQAISKGIWVQDQTRAAGHYALLFGIYSLYGYQVCPFLDQLSWYQLLTPVAVTLAIQWTLRPVLRGFASRKPLSGQMKFLFWSDFALFIAGGVALAYFNLFVHGFPLESGGKILIAFLGIGFYIAMDLALVRDRRLGEILAEGEEHFPLDENYLPFRYKFASFSVANLFVVAVISSLLIFKDLHWIAAERPDLDWAAIIIMGEVAFVVSIVGAYILLVISQYAKVMDMRLQAQNRALRRLEDGHFATNLAVTSNDEFGHMAHLTNGMAERLHLSRKALEKTQDVTMMSLISLAAKRDNETGMHLKRTQTYIAMLAQSLRQQPGYRDKISDDMIELLYKSAPLHDIGKVGIPDAILKKPGKLSDEEFEIMKQHAQIGADALTEAEEKLGGCSFLSMGREIAASHHEKWDGTGYPNGLAGEKIPLSGRLMALADVYDALRSPRVYKPAFSHEKAMSIICEGKGKHFDPDIVDAFLAIEPEVERLSIDLQDEIEAEKAEAA